MLGLLSFAKQQDPKSIDEILGRLPSEYRAIFEQRIQAIRFYPYGAYVALLKSIGQRFGKPNERFYRRLGATAGKRDLGTMFKIYAAIASPERLIRSCGRVWSSYYRNAGTMTAIEWEPESTRLRITGFPQMDRAHCQLMEGWMISTMEQIGVVVRSDARETSCQRDGGPYHEFACSWYVRA